MGQKLPNDGCSLKEKQRLVRHKLLRDKRPAGGGATGGVAAGGGAAGGVAAGGGAAGGSGFLQLSHTEQKDKVESNQRMRSVRAS